MERKDESNDVQFEDDFGDQFEEEEIVDCENEEAEMDEQSEKPGQDSQEKPSVKIFRHGVDQLAEDEELVCEPGTYDMLHKGNTDWPCLTFDVISDSKGMRTKYPFTSYVVAGSQADRSDRNRIYVMKWSRLHKTKNDEMDEASDSEGEDDDAVLDFRTIPHEGGVNRIRAMPQMSHIVATWSETGKVHVWDLQKHFAQLDGPASTDSAPRPIFTYHDHTEEGFAMAWDPHVTGRFVSGDCAGEIVLWNPVDGGWETERLGFHEGSVEDLAFKIKGDGAGHTLASSGVDGTIRIWNLDTKECVKVLEKAHDSDVNVISWNPIVGDLLLSGDDDGCFKVWNPRAIDKPMATFHWHQAAITSVAWHPTDETMLAVSSADHSVSIWDMSVEDDHEEEIPEGAEHFPAQLLFLHQGQKDIKEITWHPQLPSVIISSAGDGFNIFKPCNL